jgi:hemerythrin
MSLVWREQMSVHNRLIDSEHKYLIEQINAIEKAINSHDNHDLLIKTLNHLMDYTRTHFEHEEVIQKKIGYPEIERHKEEHRKLLVEFTSIKDKLDKILLVDDAEDAPVAEGEITDDELNDLLSDDEPVEPSVDAEALEPLVGLMRRWLVDHIIGSDLKLKPLLQKHSIDLSFS